jgi:NAD(P)-dependent dehydrogenase (short-subunit alcohol dehydrogenase family)
VVRNGEIDEAPIGQPGRVATSELLSTLVAPSIEICRAIISSGARDMIDPNGRVVLVSGANRGIGRAIGERLYAEGYSISLGAREPSSLEPVVKSMDAARVMTHGYEALDKDAPQRWVSATVARFGRIDALVNNAGTLRVLSVEEGDEPDLEAMWRVNAVAPWRMIRAAWTHLKAAGSGRVINVASISGLRVKSPAGTGLSMSKFALVALTNGVRLEGREHGIRAAALCPYFVATDMAMGFGVEPEDMSDPDTIARAAAFLIALPNTASVATWAINSQPEIGW